MITIGSSRYETMKEAGYVELSLNDGEHILQDVKTGNKERWYKNKNGAGYRIIYKNTHLEFCSSVKQ